MRLVRRIDHAGPDVWPEVSFARAHNRGKRRHRSARREQSSGRRRQRHPVAQPLEGVRLELHERGRRLVEAGEAIGRVCDEVCQRGRI